MREITRLFQKHAAPLLEKRVRIHGLDSRPELNGQLGGAVSHDPRTGRYAVALDEGASDVKMSIKVRAANLEAPPIRPMDVAICQQTGRPTLGPCARFHDGRHEH